MLYDSVDAILTDFSIWRNKPSCPFNIICFSQFLNANIVNVYQLMLTDIPSQSEIISVFK